MPLIPPTSAPASPNPGIRHPQPLPDGAAPIVTSRTRPAEVVSSESNLGPPAGGIDYNAEAAAAMRNMGLG